MVRHRNIQQCGAVLQHVLGGIDPLDPEGGKFVASIHTGKTRDSHDFADAYSKFESKVVEAFSEFLGKVFASPEDRDNVPREAEEASTGADAGCRSEQEEECKEMNEKPTEEDSEQEEEDKETNEKTTEGGMDGADEEEMNPPPNTYSPSSASITAMLATSPTPHLAIPMASQQLATPPVTPPATPTSTDLAIPMAPQSLQYPQPCILQYPH
ncbi:hypothetical protein JVT61DRAFT_1410 [Boletus reticuloceps]|uniref:Uncharacterized protein n=1 Tax=Boletus reticuloceps TaxID=495285 RepID=A0A8I3A226_9AGAM|nr:hypothetical protein JVT61DRAFT_1410 [Boletus reticuloceps]